MEGMVYLLLYVAVTHKARDEKRLAVTLLPVFKTTLLTNQWPAVC